MDDSDRSRLCEVCNSIDFPSYFQPPAHGELGFENGVKEVMYKTRKLGTGEEIRSKEANCNFCHLVYTAMDTSDNETAISISSYLCCNSGDDITGKDASPTYYILLRAKSPRGRNVKYIQLLADDAYLLGLSTDFRARVPKVAGFDMGQARKWIEICRAEHGAMCSVLGGDSEEESSPPQPVDLLAIDLTNMSICQMPYGSEYVALSYCWPATTRLTLVKSNRQALSQCGVLVENMHNLPGTVRDAIACSKKLPFRYLWIDALCIVQDDLQQKDTQLRQMDRVYGCASLTLVCAYPVARGEDDLCDGFPGFDKHNTERSRSVRLVQGIRMMIVSPCIDDYLLSTRWETRCWFQEHQLSRRLLYFTPKQVYFQCSCSAFCEDTVGENNSMSARISPGSTIWNSKSHHQIARSEGNWGGWCLSRKPVHSLSQMSHSFEMALSFYTHRNVTYPTDILNAFQGVMTVLSIEMKTDFWQGIPEKILAQALCWQLRGGFYRRRNRLEGQPPSAPLFPSWSWAGWDARVNLDHDLPIKAYRSDAEWFIVNDDGASTRLNVQSELPGPLSQRSSRSVIKAFLPNMLPRIEVDASSREWRDARTLACWTTRALFVLDGSQHSFGVERYEQLWPESANFAIKDAQGVTAGCILLPKDYVEAFGTSKVTCEFILISSNIPKQFQVSCFDESEYAIKDWCHLHVMLISRPSHLGEYEALRIGVGVLHHDAWIAAQPETDFVKLV